MKKHADKFKPEFREEEVKNIVMEGSPKSIETSKGNYQVKAVIIATGAHSRRLGIPGEGKFWGRGVSFCATCDGAFYRDKVVAVIGGGDSAVEETIFLTRFVKKAYIIHRRDKLRAVQIIQDRAFRNPKIEFIWDSEILKVNGDEVVTSITLLNKKNNIQSELSVDGVFIYIGILPNNELIASQVQTDEAGFAIVNCDMQTSIPGIFAAGDIISKKLRQVITAASDGAIAAWSAEKWITYNG
jgi:thioredoxin reductase (NADPH)